MIAHKGQHEDDRTDPETSRRSLFNAPEAPDAATSAVIRQWLYGEKLGGRTGPTKKSDIEFAALSHDLPT